MKFNLRSVLIRKTMRLNRNQLQRLFNLPADKEKSPTVLSLGGKLYVGGGSDTDGQVWLLVIFGKKK